MQSTRLLIFLAWRNVIRQRRRTIAALMAIALGVAAVVVSGGFIRDIFRQLAEAIVHSQTGHLQIAMPEFFAAGSRSPEKHLIGKPEELEALLRDRPHVIEVMGRVQFGALLSSGRGDLGVLVEGVEPAKETRLGTYVNVLQGTRLGGSDQSAVMLGEGVAKTLGLGARAPVSLVTTTAEGAMNALDFDVAAVVQSFSREYDARVVKIPLAAAQQLLDFTGVNVLVVLLDDTGATDIVASGLQAELAGRGLEVRTWRELSDFYSKAVELYQRQFGVLQLIILVMVALSVINTLNASLFERTGEFGTMRALGNRRGHVLKLVMAEGLLLGLGGSALGLGVGLAMALAISAIGIPMPPPPNSNIAYVARIAVTPWAAAGAFSIGVAAAALGALVPALRVSRVPVVEALRQGTA